jgi:hypothetical protein
MERIAHPLQSAAHCRLAEQEPRRRARDIPLLGENGKHHKQVQVGLT